MAYGPDITFGKTFSSSEAPFSGVIGSAFDDDLDTNVWWFFPPVPWWLEVDLGSGNEADVQKLRIYWSSSFTPYYIDNIELKASNTGAFGGEEVSLVYDSSPSWPEDDWLEWTFANGTNYRYYRIYVSSVDNFYLPFYEIEMMESLGTTTSSSTSSTSSTASTISTSTYSTSSTISTTSTTAPPQYSFCLFRSAAIPFESIITKAHLFLTSYDTAGDIPIIVDIRVSNEDDASAPSGMLDLITRPFSDSISWVIQDTWKDNKTYRSPDISSLLQPLIERPGWSSGNNILVSIAFVESESAEANRKWSAIEHRNGVEKMRLEVHWRAPKQLQTPRFTPEENFQKNAFDCTIVTYPADAEIYYTTDGTTPDENATLYTAPFEVYDTTTVKAIAYKKYWLDSEVGTKEYSAEYGPPIVPTNRMLIDQIVYPRTLRGSDLRFDADGCGHVVYNFTDTFGSEIGQAGEVWYGTNRSGSWVFEKVADQDSKDYTFSLFFRIKIRVDSNNVPHIWYQEGVDGFGLIKLLRYTYKTNGSWATPITATTQYIGFQPDIDPNDDTPIMFTYDLYGVQGHVVRYYRWNGTGFSSIYFIQPNGWEGSIHSFSGVIAPNGDVHIFAKFTGVYDNLIAHYKNGVYEEVIQSTRFAPNNLSTVESSSIVDSNGKLHVVTVGWYEEINRITYGYVYHFDNVPGYWRQETNSNWYTIMSFAKIGEISDNNFYIADTWNTSRGSWNSWDVVTNTLMGASCDLHPTERKLYWTSITATNVWLYYEILTVTLVNTICTTQGLNQVIGISRYEDYAYESKVLYGYNAVTIPAGARITSAKIKLTAYRNETNSEQLTWKLGFQKTGAPPSPDRTVSDFEARLNNRTALIDWLPDLEWVKDTEYESPELKAILQQVIDLNDWDSGNRVFLIIEQDSPTVDDQPTGCFEQKGHTTYGWPNYAYWPKLEVVWTNPSGFGTFTIPEANNWILRYEREYTW